MVVVLEERLDLTFVETLAKVVENLHPRLHHLPGSIANDIDDVRHVLHQEFIEILNRD